MNKRKMSLKKTNQLMVAKPCNAPIYNGSTGRYADMLPLSSFIFVIKVKKCDLASAVMEVYDAEKNKVIYEDVLTEKRPRPWYFQGQNYLEQGSHIWQWDGYDQGGVFDTAILKKGLYLHFQCKCNDTLHNFYTPLTMKCAKEKGDWLDVRIAANDPAWKKPTAHYLPALNGWESEKKASNAYDAATVKSTASEATPPAAYKPEKITITMRVEFSEPDAEFTQKYGVIKPKGSRTEELKLFNEQHKIKFPTAAEVDEATYDRMNEVAKHFANEAPAFEDLKNYAAIGLPACWSRPGNTRHIKVNTEKGQKHYEVSTIVDQQATPRLSTKVYLCLVIIPVNMRSTSYSADDYIHCFYNHGGPYAEIALNLPALKIGKISKKNF